MTKSFLQLPQHSGLDGLEQALSFRLYHTSMSRPPNGQAMNSFFVW
jgi:hypothetical protein